MARVALIAQAAVLLLLCSVGLVWADCNVTEVLSELVPCAPLLSGPDSLPTPGCCTGFKAVVAGLPECLCAMLESGPSNPLPSTFNLTFVLNLPGSCNVDVYAAGCPAVSPVASPLPALGLSAPAPGPKPTNDASTKIPGTILSILQFAAAPALLLLLQRGH